MRTTAASRGTPLLLLTGAALAMLPAASGAQRSRGAGAYPNCAAVRAAGAAPIRRGEAGYGPHLDRDNDGIGCESRRGGGGGGSGRTRRRRR